VCPRADFIVAPLYASISALLPKARLCCEALAENRRNWVALQQGEGEVPATPNAQRNFQRRTTAVNQMLLPLVTAIARDSAGVCRSVCLLCLLLQVLLVLGVCCDAACCACGADDAVSVDDVRIEGSA
jgi:hypothetical protein